jgi:hypothetical protein
MRRNCGLRADGSTPLLRKLLAGFARMAALDPPPGKLIFIRQLFGAAARSRFPPQQLRQFGGIGRIRRAGTQWSMRAYPA